MAIAINSTGTARAANFRSAHRARARPQRRASHRTGIGVALSTGTAVTLF